MMSQNVRLSLNEYVTSTCLKKEVDTAYDELKIKLSEIDADNVIKGNKDKDTNLYDQLEKTSSYKFKFKK